MKTNKISILIFCLLLTTTLSAQNWSPQNTGLSKKIYCLKAVDENTVWAGAENGYYLRTTDGGENWTSGIVPGANIMEFMSITAFSPDTAYFMGTSFSSSDGRIYKTTDGGMNWELQYRNTNPGTFLNSIAFWNSEEGIALGDVVGGKFMILTTNNGGIDWNEIPAENIPEPLKGESGIADVGGTALTVEGSNNAWFGTFYFSTNNSARVFKSADKGQNWSAYGTPISSSGSLHGITTIAFKDSLNGFAGGGKWLGTTDCLARTIDGGQSWHIVDTFLDAFVFNITYVPNTGNQVLVVTTASGAGSSQNGGLAWNYLKAGNYMGLSFVSPTIGWASGDNGTIVKFIGNLSTSVKMCEMSPPSTYRLSQNYPNPFNPVTTISYQLPEAAHVILSIYNMAGQLVTELVNGYQNPGIHDVQWNAQSLSSGIYVYELRAVELTEVRKCMLLR